MWHLHHGRWWMVQWQFAGWFSLGIHVDVRSRRVGVGRIYGPYVDFHLGCVIVSLGRNPVYSGAIERSVGCSRGGIAPWQP